MDFNIVLWMLSIHTAIKQLKISWKNCMKWKHSNSKTDSLNKDSALKRTRKLRYLDPKNSSQLFFLLICHVAIGQTYKNSIYKTTYYKNNILKFSVLASTL